MTSEEDIQRKNATRESTLKRKYEDQEDGVKRIRVFMGNSVWDERRRIYRKASWGDPVPLPTLFKRMIAPCFDDTGYVGGHRSRSFRLYQNKEGRWTYDPNVKKEYEDKHFVVMMSHFIPREAAKEVCDFAFREGWDEVYSSWWNNIPPSRWGQLAHKRLFGK